MSDNALVSIIIPAYNVEQYISRGIESCLNQTYSNIEIVIVDDGSTDGTWDVIERYQQKDKRIVAKRKPNGGVSSARNQALEIAKGDYVLFLDSDDWLTKDAVENLVKLQMQYPEYLVCTECYFVEMTESGLKYEQQGVSNNAQVVTKEEGFLTMGKHSGFRLQSSCYKLLSMSVLKQEKLCFDEKIHHGEDGLFIFEYLYNREGIAYEPIPLWNILERPGSATTSPYNSKWLTAIDAINKMLSYKLSLAVQQNLKTYLTSRVMDIEIAGIRSRKLEKEEFNYLRKVLRKDTSCLLRGGITVQRKVQYIILAFFPSGILNLLLRG